jgi:signal transduction histidine kinase/CheY-like chemotaxis protein
MYKTETRTKFFDFSVPHFVATYSIYVRSDSTFSSIEEIYNKAILVQESDVGHEYILENYPNARVITKKDWPDVLMALSKGEGDCALVSTIQGEILKQKYSIKNVKILGGPLYQQKYCMAVRKGNSELLSLLNEGLVVLKNSGKYDEIYEKWFGIYEKKTIFEQKIFWILTLILILFLILIFAINLWNISLHKKIKERTEALNLELAKSNEIKRQLEEALEEASRAEEAATVARIESEKSNEAKSVFLAGVSHELRTPLNGIVGMIQLLEATPLSMEQENLVKMLKHSANNLLRIITDLVDYTRIGSGKFRLEISEVDFDDFLKSIEPIIDMMATEKNLKFTVEKNFSGKRLLMDKDRVAQIIFNLLNNAIKFTSKGSVSLKVSLSDVLEIEVADTGVGIPEEKIKDIWTPFVQIQNAGEAKNRGFGLGLSIVRLLVSMMDGEISVQSSVGKGSVFTVKLPIKEKENHEIPLYGENILKTADENLSYGACHVLIAEDEAVNKLYIERILAKKGFIVDSAINGLEVVEKYKKGTYDVIFMDINMPELDGFEATAQIREFEKISGRKKVPIIAVTAHVYPEDIKKCLAAGMDGYISKPYNIKELLSELQRVSPISEA